MKNMRMGGALHQLAVRNADLSDQMMKVMKHDQVHDTSKAADGDVDSIVEEATENELRLVATVQTSSAAVVSSTEMMMIATKEHLPVIGEDEPVVTPTKKAVRTPAEKALEAQVDESGVHA